MGLTGLIGLFGQQRHGVGQLLQLLGGGGVGNGGGQFLLKELTNFVHGLNKQRRYRRLFFVVGGGGWTWAFQILADAVTGAGGEENFGGGKTDSGGGHCQVSPVFLNNDRLIGGLLFSEDFPKTKSTLT